MYVKRKNASVATRLEEIEHPFLNEQAYDYDV